MNKIVIYTTNICPFCVRAKSLLDRKNAHYDEIKVDEDSNKRMEMMEKSNGARTVPQIFIGERHIGGCDDLYELDSKGELDSLLRA